MATKKREAPLSELVEKMPFYRVPRFLVDRLGSDRLAYLYTLLRNKRDYLYENLLIDKPDSYFYFENLELQKYLPEKNTDETLQLQINKLCASGLVKSFYDRRQNKNKQYQINDRVFKKMYVDHGDKWIYRFIKTATEESLNAEKILWVSFDYCIPGYELFSIKFDKGTGQITFVSEELPGYRTRHDFTELPKNNRVATLWSEDTIDLFDSISPDETESYLTIEYGTPSKTFKYMVDQDTQAGVDDLLQPVLQMYQKDCQ